MKIFSIVLCLLLPLSAEEGLLLKLVDSTGAQDFKAARLVALYKSEKGTVSPFLKEGSFKAIFTGKLSLQKRSRLYFKFSGNGKATLKINGKSILEAAGKEFREKESSRLRLNPGEHSIAVEYESPSVGEASLRVLWKGRDFAWEPINPESLKYESTSALEIAKTLRHGRELTAKFNCFKCHSPGSLTPDLAMPEAFRDTPSLANAGNRFSESWMAAWIQNPKSMRAKSTMPALLKHKSLNQAKEAGDTSAADLAAYLTTKKTASYASKDLPASFSKDGGDLFHKLGCIACHSRPDKKQSSDRVPLNNIGWKFQKNTALADFLSNPAKHYKWTKMPDFSLKADEALKLAVYLMSTAKTEIQELTKGNALKGKALYEKLGCASCHEPESKAQSVPMKDLKGFEGCLSGEGVNYELSAREKAAMTLFLQKAVNSVQKRNLAEFAQRQIHEVNCTACHEYDKSMSALAKNHHETKDLQVHEGGNLDQSRPILTWFGEKLQNAYLEKILAGTLDHRPRPWLDTRMPSFKKRAALLAAGLAEAHGLSTKEEITPVNENQEIGKKITGTQGFSCIICHDAGPVKAMAAFEVKGIDLMLVGERLRPEYYLRWMLDPQRIVSNTKMPKFANEGVTALSNYFDGDAKEQFMAMWEFLKQGRELVKFK
jgi:cbb3-type cytochrome oxidase cytochrome c subunit